MVEYCLTPASFHARRSGYLYEAVAFESRARRNEKHWRPHWQTCQNLVEKFCRDHSEARSLAIFGSGCLFEVPRDRLVQSFEKIVLIDQVFPRSVRAWAKLQGVQIDLLECDLSIGFPLGLRVDLALSANLLSQLALSNPDKKRELEAKHLKELRSLEIPTLLWTDTEKIFRRRNSSEILHRQATVFTSLGTAVENWTWNLALAPEWDKEADVILKLSAHVL